MRNKLIIAVAVLILLWIVGKTSVQKSFHSEPPPEISIVKPTETKPEISESSKVVTKSETLKVPASEEKVPASKEAFEPKTVTESEAELVLARKDGDDPEAELAGMHRPDWRSGEGRMLLGKFRDEISGVELFIAISGETGADHVCLAGPGFEYMGRPGSYEVNVDSGGYGVIRLGAQDYLRVMWSVEGRRVVHGRFFKKENGQIRSVKEFSAAETKALQKCR